MIHTSNYRKHTTASATQRWLIERFYRCCFTFLRPLSLTTILDAGCGEGFTLSRLQQAGIGKKLTGIDYSEEAILLGKKQHPTVLLRVGNIYDLAAADASVDVVLCMEVLEHLEHPRKALAELHRVTKRYALLSVPNEPLFMAANFLRGKHLSRWGNHPEHINHWTSHQFRRLVEESGFTVTKLARPFPWTMVLAEK